MKEHAKKIFCIIVMLMLVFAVVSCEKGKTGGQREGTKAAVPLGEVEYTAIPFLKDYGQYRYDGGINVLYLVSSTYAEYFTNSYVVWKPMLKSAGINMDLLGPPAFSDESMISTLETSLQSGKYDLILLFPITPQAITPILDRAWEEYKTPILAYAFPPESGCGHYYLGTSFYQGGVTLGKSILKYVNKHADYFNKLKTIPVAIYTQTNAPEQHKRVIGAWDQLAADGRFSLIQQYEADAGNSLNVTETLLTTRPDVEIFLTLIDYDIPPIYQALTSGNYRVSEYASIWGFDATGAVMMLMIQDGVDGFVQGSSFIDHQKAGSALKDLVPILAGAAKQQVKIEFKPDEFDTLGTLLGNFYTTVTPENAGDYQMR
jgi:ABC-type sugar transport system substrate-binding protein